MKPDRGLKSLQVKAEYATTSAEITEIGHINRFRKLAQAGKHLGASSGEKVALKLAQAFAEIGDDICLLDREAIQGATLLLKAMAGPWATDFERNAVYSVLESCVPAPKPPTIGAR